MKSHLQKYLLNLTYGKPIQGKGEFNPQGIRKILLIRRNGIGDMICALPLIRNLRAAWPQIQIDIIASEKNACILNHLNLIDHIFLYRRGKVLFRNHYLNLPFLIKPIREEHYDLLIAIKGGFSSLLAVISYATQIPWRLGYVPSRGHSLDFCFNLQVELPVEREHQVESCLRFLKPLGLSQINRDLSIGLLPEHERYACQCLQEAHLQKDCFVLFNASSERYESRWTPIAIAQTAQELEARFQLPMILCGLHRDYQLLKHAQKYAASSIRTIITPPTIHHFAAVVGQSHFLICGDGGPMHIAAAMKRPVFVLFSATDPNIWRPYDVPFAYAQCGRFVADLKPLEVISKIQAWLPSFSKRVSL